MKTFSGRTLGSMTGALVLALGMAATGSAQTTMPASGSSQGMMGGMQHGQNGMGGMQGMMSCMHAMKNMQGMHGMRGSGMQGAPCAQVKGMHTMQATVTSVDAQTGIVEVNTGGMTLKLHFPGLSNGDLKSGDKITIMMAYSKP